VLAAGVCVDAGVDAGVVADTGNVIDDGNALLLEALLVSNSLIAAFWAAGELAASASA